MISNLTFFISVPAKIVDLPQRYLDGLQICKGDAIMIRVPYKGRPAPRITWSVDGEVIEPSRRKVEIKTHPHHSTLLVHDTEKKDSGVYKFVVENSVGSDTVNIPVHVIGKSHPQDHQGLSLYDIYFVSSFNLPLCSLKNTDYFCKELTVCIGKY